MIFKNTLIAATLLLSITSVQAALVESDWQSTGDALATLDTETGIEWLDLTQTDNMSISQAENLTGTGGIFNGWRLPTRTEVTQMLYNAFPSQVEQDGSVAYISSDEAVLYEAVVFKSLFGITYVTPTREISMGMFKSDEGAPYPVAMTGIYHNYNARNINFYSYHLMDHPSGITITTTNPVLGVYLVSDGGTTLSSQQDPSINANNANAPAADVSSPALLGLMSLGLFGFAARRRSSF
jgi:hypothetical protein